VSETIMKNISTTATHFSDNKNFYFGFYYYFSVSCGVGDAFA